MVGRLRGRRDRYLRGGIYRGEARRRRVSHHHGRAVSAPPSSRGAGRSGCASLGIDTDQRALRDGLLTSLANPKLAVFFVALFPQFVPPQDAVFPTALGMAAVLVAVDLIWYSVLAFVVSRAKRALAHGPWQRRIDRLTGAVLVGLGVRLVLERR
jgi:threonine/homoserine/homoserine lactone efflux protein